jgi:hypothetical protein
MRTILIAAAVLLLAAPAVPASASSAHKPRTTLCTTAFNVRQVVIKRHGKRAPGRNICRQGVRHTDNSVTKATTSQKARYIRAMRALLIRAPYVMVVPGWPRIPPAGTMTAKASPTGLAACIVHYESRGNPQANNGSHFGIGQWDLPTWRAHGGLRYAQTPLGASYDQQLQILTSALERFGCSAWCPFDPC